MILKKNRKDYIFVSIQFLLFGIYFFDFLPKFEYPKFIVILGLILAITGLLVALVSLFELNTNLSIFPTPKTNSELITTGFYRWSRHPIYSGILLFTLGFAFYSYSWYRLLIFCCLLILFYLKSSYEELQLLKKFKDYPHYKQNVGRFFLKIKRLV